MPICFLDTSALQHCYLSGPQSRRMRRLLSDRRFERHVADLTVVEIASTLARHCRTAGRGVRDYDSMDRRFFRQVAEGGLHVRQIGQRDILRARNLLRFAGVIKGKNLRSGDALIASCCLALAQERKTKVAFYTSDWTLYRILRDINAFRSAMCLRYVGNPRDPAIPASTC